jgi:transcriptional regulator with XRE-family HTH domain
MGTKVLCVTGEMLQRLRLIRGVGQKEIANALNITQQAYSKIEKSKCIDEKRLVIILNFLRYSKNEVLSLQDILLFPA